MPLSEGNRKTFLVNLHKSIEENANGSANDLFHGRYNQLINYPPNGGLTKNELKELEYFKGKDELRSALRKILASAISDVFFDVFNIIDGSSDPDPETGEWSEVMLIDKEENFDEDIQFLHDDFYGTYWDWKAIRKNSNWSLDLENGSQP